MLWAVTTLAMAQTPEDARLFKSGGRERIYFLHLPQELPKNAPLVFVLHGYGGSAAGMARFSEMNPVADRHGFAVCYPQGVEGEDQLNSWNAGYSNPRVDDVRFLSELARHLQHELGLSRENTFSAGMSNGGDMCYVLACRKPDVFSAVAPVAGCMMESTFQSCGNLDPVPLMEIHGTADSTTFWSGDPDYSVEYGGYLGVPETIGYWVEKNGCTRHVTDTLPDMDPTDGSLVVRTRYTGGIDNHQVWLYKLVGGGHDWPGTWGNRDLIASEEIWNFFRLFLR